MSSIEHEQPLGLVLLYPLLEMRSSGQTSCAVEGCATYIEGCAKLWHQALQSFMVLTVPNRLLLAPETWLQHLVSRFSRLLE